MDARQMTGGDVHLLRFLELCQSLTTLVEDGQADAHHGGDIDLDVFFLQARERVCELSDAAKELLARNEEARIHEDELVTEASMESFPASDPPAY